MHHWRRQLDMAHALAPDFRLNDFDAALLADHAAMAHAFVFAAIAFVVFGRTENFRAEQTVALRLEGPVVDGLGFSHFAMGPRANLVRRGDRNLDRVKTEWVFRFFE